jgi:heme exporter protein D
VVAAFVAHAGGTGWDEVAVFVLPVVVLVVLQVLGRRKKRDTDGEADEQERR